MLPLHTKSTPSLTEMEEYICKTVQELETGLQVDTISMLKSTIPMLWLTGRRGSIPVGVSRFSRDQDDVYSSSFCRRSRASLI